MESVEEKELREKIENTLKQEGFKSTDPTGSFPFPKPKHYYTMEVKHEGTKQDFLVWLNPIYGSRNTGHKFRGITITSGLADQGVTVQILLNNSSNTVIKSRVKKFTNKYVEAVKYFIERQLKFARDAENKSKLKSSITNPRFSGFEIGASKYRDEYTITVRHLKVDEVKDIIKLLNKMDKK